MAKCETRQALFNFRNIVNAADGVIISRGNLGLDVVGARHYLITVVHALIPRICGHVHCQMLGWP